MGSEAQFLRKLFNAAADCVTTQLKNFNPKELQLYSRTLTKLATQLAATPTDATRREAFIQSIQKDLQEAQRNPPREPLMFLNRVSQVGITAFGSTVMGTGLRFGDLDISLSGIYTYKTTNKQISLADPKKQQLHGLLLQDLLKFLRMRNRLRSSSPAFVLRNARIPLLKFTDRKYEIQCDVSIGNESGVIRSRILGEIIKAEKTVPLLIQLIKRWARAHSLNDAAAGSLGSYPLTIIVIAFCSERGLLPSHEALRPYFDMPHLKNLDIHCDKLSKTMQQFTAAEKQEPAMLETFLSMIMFLALYFTRESLYDGFSPRVGICCREAFVIDHAHLASKVGAVIIRDPFEVDASCSKPFQSGKLHKGSTILQKHVAEVITFLSCPAEERRDHWRTLFKSLFDMEIRFKDAKRNTTASSVQQSVNTAEDVGDQWMQYYDELVRHFAEREGRGVPMLHNRAFEPWFLKKIRAVNQSHTRQHSSPKPSSTTAPTSETESLFNLTDDQSIAVPVQ